MMTSVRLERLGRWMIGALMLLLFHGLGPPRTARAGCGHLATSRSERVLESIQLDVLITGHSTGARSDDTARAPMGRSVPGRPTPCSGPGCSGRVPMPVPAAPPGCDRIDLWGNLHHLASSRILLALGWVIDFPVARPVSREPSIFRPPPA